MGFLMLVMRLLVAQDELRSVDWGKWIFRTSIVIQDSIPAILDKCKS